MLDHKGETLLMASQQQQNFFEDLQENPIFQNQDYLESEFIPSKKDFKGREKEIEQIKNYLGRISHGKSGQNFIVTGNTGYGKTACVKIVLNDLERYMRENGSNFEFLHVDDNSSERDVLRGISSYFGWNYRGNDLKKYYNKLEEELIDRDLDFVLVLDELDDLFKSSSDSDHGNQLLKRLYETRAEVMNAGSGGLTVIGITNNVNVEELLSSKNVSRGYTKNTIHFSAYNAPQLKKILNARAEKAFKDQALDDGIISKISAYVAQEDGDARSAIQTLRMAGQLALEQERETVPRRFVDKARNQIEKDKVIEAVEKLPKQSKVIMYSLLDHRQEELITGELYDHYQNICTSENISDITQRRFRDLIKDLDMMGLLKATPYNKSDTGGRTHRIRYDHSQKVLDDIKSHIEEKIFYIED